MLRIAVVAACMLGALLVPGRASAAVACSVTGVATIDFGTQSPISSSPVDLSQSFTITCTLRGNDIPGLTGNHTLNLCVGYNNGTAGASAGGNRQLVNSGNNAIYDLYTTGSYSGTHWGSRSGTPSGTVVASSLTFNKPVTGNPNLSGTTSSITIYPRLNGSQSTLPPSATAYTSTLTQTVESFWDSNASCAAGGTVVTTTTTSQAVNVTYQKECVIGTIGTLQFTSTGFITANIDNATNASVTCTKNTGYTVSLSAGSGTGATVTSRTMTRTVAPASTVSYGLYRDPSRSLNWGVTSGTDTLSGTGTGSAASIPIYGRVPPQTTPEPGSYQDTVVLTVTF